MSNPIESFAVHLKRVDLVSCRLEQRGGPSSEFRHRLELVSFQRQVSQDHSGLVAFLEFDAFFKVPDPKLEFRFAYAMTYRAEQATEDVWTRFKDPIILAHAIPYIREFLSSTTSRMIAPTLRLPVVNAHAMFERYAKRSVPTGTTPPTAGQ